MPPPILHRMRSILTMKGDGHTTERTLRAEHLEARFALTFGVGIMGEWVSNLTSDDASSPAEDLASLIENRESLTSEVDNPDLASTTDIEPMILGTEYGSTVGIDTRSVIDEYSIHRGDFLDGVIPLSDIQKESARVRAVPFAWTIPQAWVDLNRPAEISIQRRDEVDVAVVRWMVTQDHFLTAAASEATVQDVDASGRPIHQISTVAWRMHSSRDTESDHSSTVSSLSWNLHRNELSNGLIGLYVTGPFWAAGNGAESVNCRQGEPSFVTTAMAWKSSESNEAGHELSPSDIVRTAAYLDFLNAKAEDRRDGLDAPGLCETLAAIDDVILRHADSLVMAATAMALCTQVWLLRAQSNPVGARDQKPPGALNSE
ncbi:MAG: hypothetical protein U0892_05490 [Pirellulales bacterium]